MRTRPLPLCAVVLALSGSSLGLAAGPDGPVPAGRGIGGPRQTAVVEAVRRVKDAVVNIHSERHVKMPGTSDELFALAQPGVGGPATHTHAQNRVNGMGTGIVIDPRGYVITNQHVVEDVSLIRVRLSDGTTVSARILVRDPESDLALIKIDPPRPLAVMPLGTSKDLMVGETVIAIGNAYGYDHTVTVGVVSAIGRDVTLNKDVRYQALIQTDASINPGNSGGPLLNIHGELIGVNVAIRAGAQGIGFAIPVDTMVRVGTEMLSRLQARARPASVGLVVRDDARSTPDRTIREVVVENVYPASAAARAGLQKGDVLTQVGAVSVHSSLDLPRALLAYFASGEHEALALQVRRDGSSKRLELALAPPAAIDNTALAGGASGGDQVWRKLGVRLQPVGAATVGRNHPQLNGGLTIAEVRAESPAARAGLKLGDVLVGLHQWEMLSLENVVYVLNHPDRTSFSPVRFYILRGGQVHRGTLQVGE